MDHQDVSVCVAVADEQRAAAIRRVLDSLQGLRYRIATVSASEPLHQALRACPDDFYLLDQTLHETLQGERHERRQVEDALRRKTGFMALLQEIAVAANEAVTVEGVLQFALDRVCAFTGWPIGHVYRRDEATGELVPTDLWHADGSAHHQALRAVTRTLRFGPGEGLPGRVGHTGDPAWIIDVQQDEDFLRTKLDPGLAVKAAFAFPVRVGEAVVAVLEFFAEEAAEPDAPLLEVMAHVGTQLGRVVERRRAEALLLDKERMLEAAQRIARLGYWEWNVVTGALTWSDELYRIFGLDPGQEVSYERYLACIHPDDRARIAGIIEASLHTHAPFRHTHRILCPDGRLRYVQGDGEVEAAADGAVLRMFGTALDVTEARLAEEELRESEARYRLLAEHSSDMIVRTTAAGVITYASPACRTLLGYDPDALVGRSGYDFIHPDDVPRGEAVHASILDVPDVQTLQYRFRKKDGGYLWVESTARAVRDPSTQAVRELVSATRDISERRRAEEALRASEERLRALTETAVEAIITADGAGRVVGWNRGAANVFGYSFEEIVGRPLTVLMPERYRAAHEAGMARLAETGAARLIGQTIELEGVRRDGTTFPLELSLSSWQADGKAFYAGIIRDITQRKQAEEAVRQSREQLRKLAARLQAVREQERTRLSRDVHDVLGQALTGLRMDVALLEKELPGEAPALHDQIEAMKRAIDETVQVTRRIAADLRPGILDTLGVVAALEWETEKFAARSGLACTFADHTDEVEVDPQRATAIFRVFQEILTNVARHAEAARVTVTVALQDGCFVLTVADDGRGIREADVRHSNSLGLLGMRERVLSWGGTVAFAGTPEQGTTVTLTLPIHQHQPAL